MRAMRPKRVVTGRFRITRVPPRTPAWYGVTVGDTAVHSSLLHMGDPGDNLIEIEIVETGFHYWWSRSDMEPIYS